MCHRLYLYLSIYLYLYLYLERDNGSGIYKKKSVKLTNTKPEYKSIGWSKLNNIFWLFVLVGPPYHHHASDSWSSEERAAAALWEQYKADHADPLQNTRR